MSTVSTAQAVTEWKQAEAKQLGYNSTVETQYSIHGGLREKRVQIRSDSNRAPQGEVIRYAEQMRTGSEFPHMVVTRDGYVVDGNTTLEAALREQRLYHPAVVLDVSWETRTPKQENDLIALGTVYNQINGRSMSKNELKVAINSLLENNRTVEFITNKLGVSPSMVRGVRQMRLGEEKIKRLGIQQPNREAVVRALGDKAPQALTKEPFRALVLLADEAGLNSQEINQLAREATEREDETLMLQLFSQRKKEMQTRIKQVGTTGSARISNAAKLRRSLGHITKFKNNPELLIEPDPSAVAGHLEMLETSKRTLEAAISAQREV